jgi:GntR family transcriptional regulator
MKTQNPTEENRRKIISYIRRYIQKHRLQENDPVPSENTIADLYGVSRNVVRSSFAVLTAQGILYSEKGRGFFVARRPRPIVFEHDNSLGFSEILNKGHRTYKSRVIDIRLGRSSSRESSFLGIEEGSPVYRLEHVRSLGGTDFAFCLSVIPQKIAPDFDSHLDGFFSVNKIMMDCYGYSHPICRKVELSASLPTMQEISILGIQENMPLLSQESVFNIEGIGNDEFFVVRARGDMFRFSMTFK